MKAYLYLLLYLLLINTANAQIDLVTEYRIDSMVNSVNTYDRDFNRTNPFRDTLPYSAKIGLETIKGNLTYSGGYQIKKDSDIYSGLSYDYQGVFIQLKYRHCIYKC